MTAKCYTGRGSFFVYTNVFVCLQHLPKRSDESLKDRFSLITKNADSFNVDCQKHGAVIFKAHKKAEKRKDLNGPSVPNTEAEGEPSVQKLIKSSFADMEIKTMDLTGEEQQKWDGSATEPNVNKRSETDILSSAPVPRHSYHSHCVSVDVLQYQKLYNSMLVEILECEIISDRIDWYKSQTRRFVKQKKDFKFKYMQVFWESNF